MRQPKNITYSSTSICFIYLHSFLQPLSTKPNVATSLTLLGVCSLIHRVHRLVDQRSVAFRDSGFWPTALDLNDSLFDLISALPTSRQCDSLKISPILQPLYVSYIYIHFFNLSRLSLMLLPVLLSWEYAVSFTEFTGSLTSGQSPLETLGTGICFPQDYRGKKKKEERKKEQKKENKLNNKIHWIAQSLLATSNWLTILRHMYLRGWRLSRPE